MCNSNDLIGQQFGLLTVLDDSGLRFRSSIVWRCRCECGSELLAISTELKSGRVSSCPDCRRKQKKSEFIGLKFGKLTVLNDSGARLRGCVVWHCRCDCGNEVDVPTSQLKSGRVKSCPDCRESPMRSDFVGLKFGKLTVLNDSGARLRGCVVWHCRCECGNDLDVPTADLKKGRVKSCPDCTDELRKTEFVGQKFGRLTVLRDSGARIRGNIVWRCRCECGNELDIPTTYLTSGHIKNCSDCRKKYSLYNLIGQKFGKLTVLRDSGDRYHSSIVWHCQCDCGNEVDVPSIYLRNGKITSCNDCDCLDNRPSVRSKYNLIGQKFGTLTILNDSGDRFHHSVVWRCRCDCGKELDVPTCYLRSGQVKSCPDCRSKNSASAKNSAVDNVSSVSVAENKRNRKDITGMVFGELTAVRPTEKRMHGNVVWECLCSCGATSYVTANRLLTGATRSCGHLRLDTIRTTLHPANDITGVRSGRLVADRRVGTYQGHGAALWFCNCDCGGSRICLASTILHGKVTSCGCAKKNRKSSGYLITCPKCGKIYQADTLENAPPLCPDCTEKQPPE